MPMPSESHQVSEWVRQETDRRAFNNARTDTPQLPVASCGIQVRPAVRGRGFVDFSGRDRADQHAITLNQRKIGRHHEFGVLKHLTHRSDQFLLQAATVARRWIPHKHSPCATLEIEEFSSETSLQEPRELWVRRRLVWNTQRQLASPCKCHQSRRHPPLISSLSGRNERCDYFTAISYQHGLARPDFPNVLAQPVLQIPQAYALHMWNVAS
jgi:hypothetical protein